MPSHEEDGHQTGHIDNDGEQTQTGQTQLQDTLKWLNENYERAEGICLPRCVLYTHYLDLCKKRLFTPAGAATFGKIIRQMFPKLTTRRLGTRGQSKYHYYGIGIKKTSIYYHSVYSGKGLTRFSETKVITEGSARKFSLSSKSGTLLPDFLKAGNLIIEEENSSEKVETFLLMYQTHCQRILDTVVSSNFEEIQNFLLHFWQGMPKHMQPLLSCDVIIDVIALCDSVLYKVLIDVLIPSKIQDIPEGLRIDILTFAKKFPVWLDSSLDQMSKKLRLRKMKVLSSFVRSLRRQVSFVHLAQTARGVLLNHEAVNQMTRDLVELNLSENFSYKDMSQSVNNIAEAVLREFESLLSKQAPLEAFVEWIDSLIDRFVLKDDKLSEYSDRSASFMLKWTFFTSKIVRDLTLKSAVSFGSLHVVHMMLTEYTFLVIESQHDKQTHENMVNVVQRNMKQTEEISTKSTIRSSIQRPSNASANGAKNKRRKLSTKTETSPSKTDPSTLIGDTQPKFTEDTNINTQHDVNNTSLLEQYSESYQANTLDQVNSCTFRPFCQKKNLQPVNSNMPYNDNEPQIGYPSVYGNYPLHSTLVDPSYNSRQQYHHHFPVTYPKCTLASEEGPDYSVYTTKRYELPGTGQHPGYLPHGQLDGCYMNFRPNDSLEDIHRHTYLRFNSSYNDMIGYQPRHIMAPSWLHPSSDGCFQEPTLSTVENEATNSSSAGGSSNSRFMEIVHSGRDQAASYETPVDYDMSKLCPGNP
ncbi:DNA-binding protein RFX6-like, partial [Asterias rubens]|uniref:DNA-binding protein RFX6-like n=1 Tax=Asterias rubens TaxID=7604 RepID=UPI0014555B39